MKILDKCGKTTSVAATTSEETLAEVLIPANKIGKNGVLRVTSLLDVTGSANNKRVRIYLGAALLHEVNLNAATVQADVNQLTIMNRDNVMEQVSAPKTTPPAGIGASTDTLVLSAVDTSVNQTLRITGEKDNAGDEIHLRGYVVEYAR